MTKNTQGEPPQAGGLYIFLGLFVVAGIGAVLLGVVEVLRHGPGQDGAAVPFIVGGAFIFLPGYLILRIHDAQERHRIVAEKRAVFPEEPWRWLPEWEDGTIRPESPRQMAIYWIFSLVFSAFGIYLLLHWDDVIKDGPSGYVFLSVPLLGFGLLTHTIFATIRHSKWEDTLCVLGTYPGVIGGTLCATIQTSAPADHLHEGVVRLTCYAYNPEHGTDTGQGTRKLLWKDEKKLDRDLIEFSGKGSATIPVRISIPDSCEPTTPGIHAVRIQWELSVLASGRGMDLSVNYVVPVFQLNKRDEVYAIL